MLLWEYDPQAGLRLSRDIDAPLPLRRYVDILGRFRHVTDEQVAHMEAKIVENVALIRQLEADGKTSAVARVGVAGRLRT